jgi:DNA helicase II / ATP-dependent DNA helicase PcrA
MRLTDPAQLRDVLGIPFSEQQLTAIAAPLEPAVIIAGAGSGKTTVMAARVVWLVGSGQVRADEVLGLTFTRKAAGELGSRVRRALTEAGVADPDGAEELILTYDAFAGRLVAEHGLLLGIESGLRMITGAARYRLAARAVADAVGPLRHLSRLRPVTITERLVELAAEMRSHLVTPAALASHAELFAAALDAAPRRSGTLEYKAVQDARAAEAERLELAQLVLAYEQLKAEAGYVEFADQMALAAQLSTEVPSVPGALRREFAVVLLDEYQDTSAAQATLLRGLFSGPAPSEGRGHPVTAVGDPCQAIYGWRGAAASNILDFGQHFPRADDTPAVSYALTVNRRSGQRVLDAANELATAVRSDPALAVHGLELDLVAPPQTPPGRVESAAFVTWPEEVAAIADRIADLHSSGGVSAWSQIAVLCRRNSHVAAVYAALVERDVPAEIVGLGGLLDLPPIADVVATLGLLADPTANPAALRVLTSARWAIGIPDLALLGRRAREMAEAKRSFESEQDDEFGAGMPAGDPGVPSLLEALADPGRLPYSAEARSRFAAFTAELSGLRRHVGNGLIELVTSVVSALGLAIETEVIAPGGSAPLGAFVQAVAGYVDIDSDASLSGLLAWFEAERTYGVGLEQGVASSADSVKVLTVHKAKGLEWEVVFLPGLASGVFPTDRVSGNWLRNAASLPYPLRGDAAALPQLARVDHQVMAAFGDDLTTQQRLSEDRLAYVAVTRAKQLLVASTHTWQATLARPRQPSRYFEVLVGHADAVRLPPQIPETNPLVTAVTQASWPEVGGDEASLRRKVAAASVEAARAVKVEQGEYPLPGELDLDGEALVERWRSSREHLVAAELADRAQPGAVPDYLSVTGVAQLQRDPKAFAAGIRRPMPRLVSEAQRWGIGFHQWLENRFGAQSMLLDADPAAELAGAEFEKLRAGFEASPYADAVPVAVEAPFTLVLAGRLVRGRIDAVFGTSDGRMQVVDWKTGNLASADPLQLACYRLAWAELNGLAVESVDAVFYDLHSARIVRPEHLAGRAELEQLLRGLG